MNNEFWGQPSIIGTLPKGSNFSRAIYPNHANRTYWLGYRVKPPLAHRVFQLAKFLQIVALNP